MNLDFYKSQLAEIRKRVQAGTDKQLAGKMPSGPAQLENARKLQALLHHLIRTIEKENKHA